MRRVLVDVAAIGVLLAVGANCTAGEQSESLADDYIIGEWSVEGTMGGDTFTGSMQARTGAGESCVVFSWITRVPGKKPTHGFAVGGVDPKTEEWVECTFESNGSYYTTRYEPGDTGDVGETHGKLIGMVEGKAYKGSITVDRKGRDHFIWAVDSDEGDDWKFVYRRKMAAAADDDGLWQAYREAAVGTWEGRSTLIRDFPEQGTKKGDKFIMLLKAEDCLNGNALDLEAKFEIPSRSHKSESRATVGWDPHTRQVRLLAYWSVGVVEEIVVSRHRGNRFFGTYSAKFPGQPVSRAKVSLDYSTPDTYVITFLDGPMKGHELNRFKRVK